MFKIFTKSPGLLLSIPTYIIKAIFNVVGIEIRQPTDYKEPLGFAYIVLFFIASVPLVGAISDFIIIIKSLRNGRFFLATMTLITRFLSHFLAMSFIDLGVLFKIFYSMDTLSVLKYSKKSLGNIEDNFEKVIVNDKLEQIRSEEEISIKEPTSIGNPIEAVSSIKEPTSAGQKGGEILNSFENEIGKLFQ